MANDDSTAVLHALLSVTEQSVRQAGDLAPATKAALATSLERIRTQLMAPDHRVAAAPETALAGPPGTVWRPVVGSDRFAGLILLPPTASPPPQLETCSKCNGQRVAGTGV